MTLSIRRSWDLPSASEALKEWAFHFDPGERADVWSWDGIRMRRCGRSIWWNCYGSRHVRSNTRTTILHQLWIAASHVEKPQGGARAGLATYMGNINELASEK